MEERDQHIDVYFANMGGYTEQPPAEVWTALDQRLDKPRKKYAIWWWLCLVVAVAGGTMLYALKQEPATKKATSVAIQQPAKQANNTITAPTSIEKTTAPVQPIYTTSSTHTATKTTQPTTTKPRQVHRHAPVQSVTASAEQHEEIAMKASVSQSEILPPAVYEEKPSTTGKPESAKEPAKQPEKDYLTLMPMAGKRQQPAAEHTNTEQYIALLPQAGKPVVKTEPVVRLQAKPVAIPAPQTDVIVATSATQKVAAKKVELKQEELAEEMQTGIIRDPVIKKPNRWEIGMKLGYEGGVRSFSSSALTIAPYIQYAINSRLSLLTQPTFKYTWIQKYIISNDSYHRILDSSRQYVQPITYSPSGFLPRFAYQERYDSIIATQYVTNSRFFSADLPLMLSYKVKPKLSVYGGVNLNFTKIGIVTDEKWHNVLRNDTLDAIIPDRPIMSNSGVDFDTLWVSQVFQHSSRPYSEYNAATQHGGTASPFRLGVTFGISYAYKERLLFDIRYRQNITGLSAVPNVVIRRLYSQPYFNISMGYRIFK